VSEWAAVVSGTGSVALAAALLYSARQVKTLRAQLMLENYQAERSLRAQRASNDLKVMERVMAVDRLFIDAPSSDHTFMTDERCQTTNR
jgi:hypothetical protein